MNRPFALIDHFDLRHMLDAKSPIQEQLFMHHAPHALSNAESAKEVYNQLLDEARMRSDDAEYFSLESDDLPINLGQRQMTYSHDFQDMNKSESIDYEFCDCCSPGEIAFEFLKAKKKSKPFHERRKKLRRCDSKAKNYSLFER